MSFEVPFGPSGKTVYERTYSRTKPDGTKETWHDTVRRVVDGNLALVYGEDVGAWAFDVQHESVRLEKYMNDFAIIPAGRHLWATGVTGFLNNCFHAGWGDSITEHFEFTSNRLFEGGGVGANYSLKHIGKFGAPRNKVNVHVISDPDHQDIEEMTPHLTDAYVADKSDFLVGDTREGWTEALCHLIGMFFGSPDRGFSVTYDVSDIRPSGSPLVSSGGTASGPAPFVVMIKKAAEVLQRSFDAKVFTPMDAMEIDHSIAEAVVAGGNRRSARMSIVHWNDPYIFDFIGCKQDTGKHWTTNISVEIDGEFLDALNAGDAEASQVHQAVCRAALENGEPGYWNSSLSNVGEIEEVTATNPCGEIPLEPWGVCNLGHVNMDYFAGKSWEELEEAHRLVTRFLIRATFADANDPKQRAAMDRNRRIGVGHLGVQGYWAKQGVKYSEIPLHAPEELTNLYKTVRAEAREYAFKLRIPEPVKVTTVAPTGSVAKLPGVTEGIHPLYAKWFELRVRFSDRDAGQVNQILEAMAAGFTVEDDIYDASGHTKVVVYPTENILVQQVRNLGFDESVVQSADELLVSDMLEVQKVYQKYWADNAVSYTVNIAPGYMTADRLGKLLEKYLPYLKGTTIMVDASRKQAPYTRISQSEYIATEAKRVEDSTSEECSNGACPVR